MKNSRFWEVLLKVIVAAATAAITALTTTSCMGQVAHSKEERGLTDGVLSVPSLNGIDELVLVFGTGGQHCHCHCAAKDGCKRHQSLFHCRIA